MERSLVWFLVFKTPSLKKIQGKVIRHKEFSKIMFFVGKFDTLSRFWVCQLCVNLSGAAVWIIQYDGFLATTVSATTSRATTGYSPWITDRIKVQTWTRKWTSFCGEKYFLNDHVKKNGLFLVTRKIYGPGWKYMVQIRWYMLVLGYKLCFDILIEIYVLDSKFNFLSVFLPWSEWSTCSLTCGSGEETRTRACDKNCDDVRTDDLSETQSCNDDDCPGKHWCMRDVSKY